MLQWACLQANNLWFHYLYLEMERFIMVEEHLGSTCAGRRASWFEQRKDPDEEGRMRTCSTITLVLLPFVWAGFIYSLFTGNEGNMNSHRLRDTSSSRC